jgi:hypothetical protein
VKIAGATRPLLPLAAVTAGLASGSAVAAEWTFSPSADLSTQTQQNPRLTTEKDHKDDVSNGLGATAGIGLQRRTERTTLVVSPVFRAYRYSDDENLDRDEENVNLSYDWFGEKVSWKTSANAARDTTLTSELGTTGLTQGNQRHESWGASIGPTWALSERWQLQSSLQTYANRYPDQQLGLSNYKYSTALAGTTYVATEKFSLSLYGTAGKLDSEGNRSDTDDKSANIQLSYAWSPLTSFSASIGRSWVTSDAGRKTGLLYSVSASRSFEKSFLSLSASRRQSPSGSALLTQQEETRLSFGSQLTEQLSATASASYSKRRNVLEIFSVDLQEVRYSRVDLGLAWRMAPNWRLGVNLGAASQQVDSIFVGASPTARAYEVRLGLSWNGDPYVW